VEVTAYVADDVVGVADDVVGVAGRISSANARPPIAAAILFVRTIPPPS
jgi:hypothetical protein